MYLQVPSTFPKIIVTWFSQSSKSGNSQPRRDAFGCTKKGVLGFRAYPSYKDLISHISKDVCRRRGAPLEIFPGFLLGIYGKHFIIENNWISIWGEKWPWAEEAERKSESLFFSVGRIEGDY
jgi:hypothetical protein